MIVFTPYRRGIVKVALAAGLWGAAYPLTKGALAHVHPIGLGTLRFLLAAVLLMILARSRPLQGIEAADRPTVVKLAFWGGFVLILGMNYGLRWAPATAASIISGMPPLFTVILAALWLGEPFRRRHLIATTTALAGLALLTNETSTASGNDLAWLGCLLVLLPQFAWAMYGVIGKSLIERISWQYVCRDTFALGALMLAPFAAIETWLQGQGSWTPMAVGTLLYLAFANSVCTYGLWNSALHDIPVSTASFVLYLQPVSGAVLSWWLFGESLGGRGILGSLLIFSALALVLTRSHSD